MRTVFVGTNDPELDRYPPGGGIESQIWPLAQHLSASGHDVHILTRLRAEAREKPYSVHIHEVASRAPSTVMSHLRFSANCRKIIEKLRPDVTYLAEKLTSMAISRTRFAKVYYTHNKDTFRDYRLHGHSSPLRTGFARMIENRVMRRCNLIICPTEDYRIELAERGFTNTVVIPHGIQVRDYQNLGDRKFVFFTGQLHRVKGIDCLLKAFARIHPEFPEYSLVVGGEGPERGRLERDARMFQLARHVRFRSWCDRSELLTEFATCSVYVLPSLAESFGIVVLEAMASGKPVIASNIAGPRNVIRHGVDGLLFEPGNATELAECLRRLLADVNLRSRMGAQGRQRVAEHYDIQPVCEAMERTLIGVVS